jgi:hypothetical protein
MAAYVTLTTPRLTDPDPVALAAAVKALDATAVLVAIPGGTWRGKKATAWTAGDLSAAQTALDTVAALTPQLDAQHVIDGWPIVARALVGVIKDQFNVLRAGPALPLGAITDAQVISAIRAKAATL